MYTPPPPGDTQMFRVLPPECLPNGRAPGPSASREAKNFFKNIVLLPIANIKFIVLINFMVYLN
jgi:hypothetical protein